MKQSDKSTAQIIHEYGSMLTTYYLIAMFGLLPLYYNNGYVDIADAKYKLYRVLTVTFVILVGLICFIIERILCKKEAAANAKLPLTAGAERPANSVPKDQTAAKKRPENSVPKVHPTVQKRPTNPVPIVLFCVHLGLNLATYLFSIDRNLSIIGNGSWHMGILSQVLFLVSALLVYYYYVDKYVVYIAFAIGAGVSSLLIILNGFDIYPLKMGDKYNLFTSTLGQTNWACMYLSVMMGAGMGMFIYEKDLIRRIIIIVTQTCIFAGAWEIGSDTMILVMAGEFFILLGICIKKRELMTSFSELLITFGVATSLDYLLIYVIFPNRFTFVDEYNDGPNKLLRTGVGFLILAAGVLLYTVLYLTRKNEWKAKILSTLYKIVAAIAALSVIGTLAAIIITTISPEKMGGLSNIGFFNLDVNWGNRRGANWKYAVIAFTRMPFLRNLLGVGQGCYQQYLGSFNDLNELIEVEFMSKALVNAHNEYLNMLVENGALGCLSYIGIIVTAFISMWKRAEDEKHALIGLIAVTGYVVCSMFCFQHVYATSFMYLFIAIAINGQGQK